jgi:hypothetical protein
MTGSISGGSLELKNRNVRALVAKFASAMTATATSKPVKCMPEIKELGSYAQTPGCCALICSD